MGLTFLWAEKQVDDQVKQHPDGYRDDDKIFAKDKEELSEMKTALAAYKASPTEENLKALKTEIGDRLFPILCFVNKNNISLEECFNLMMEKNRNKAENDYKKEEK